MVRLSKTWISFWQSGVQKWPKSDLELRDYPQLAGFANFEGGEGVSS